MHISYLLSVEYKCLLPTKSDSRLDKILDSATLYEGDPVQEELYVLCDQRSKSEGGRR
jgi:hypothetical protein